MGLFFVFSFSFPLLTTRFKAIASPSPQTEEEAWAAVCPAVDKLHKYYNYSISLGELLTMIVNLPH